MAFIDKTSRKKLPCRFRVREYTFVTTFYVHIWDTRADEAKRIDAGQNSRTYKYCVEFIAILLHRHDREDIFSCSLIVQSRRWWYYWISVNVRKERRGRNEMRLGGYKFSGNEYTYKRLCQQESTYIYALLVGTLFVRMVLFHNHRECVLLFNIRPKSRRKQREWHCTRRK